jgi:superfamily II DNA or RNA helicase
LAVAAGATRILIADAVGLGKTVQAGLIVAHLAAPARVLIATPAGLREQWRLELARHFGLSAVVADTSWLAQRTRQLPQDISPWALPEIYVASFDLVKRPEVLRPLEEVAWDALIVDEAHNAAPGTARRAALDSIGRRSRRVVLLTATPHAGDDDAYEALLGIGAAGPRRSPPLVFRRTRGSLGGGAPRRSLLLAVRPTLAERRMHRVLAAYAARVVSEARGRDDRRARLAAIVLRKRALSSAASLALSAARRLDLLAGVRTCETAQPFLPFGDEAPLEDHVPDDVLAAPGLADAAREQAVLTAIVEGATRAALQESKVRRLIRLLSRIAEPAIVFTEYRDTLTRLAAALEASGLLPIVLHGGQAPAERAAVQRAFNAGGGLLLATDAACEGLNLHARCRLVVHFELPWTPARLEQRTGRVNRIGQRQRVHEILLVARDTAERMVLAPLAARAARARRAVGGSSLLLDRLTESHIAAAVLEGEALPRMPAPAAHPSDPGFRASGEVEAERVCLARRHLAISPHRGDGTVSELWLCAPRRHRPARQVDAVYAFEILTGDGEAVHSEMLVARHTLCPPVSFRTAADLKHWARRWRQEDEPALRRGTRIRLRGHAAVVSARIRRALLVAGEREKAIASVLEGTSHDLVQAGLFDRRAVRERDAARRAAGAPASEPGAQCDSHSAMRLKQRLRLLALVPR